MSYLNTKDKIVAALMGLSTLGLLGAFVALLILGDVRAGLTLGMQARARTTSLGGESLAALVLGGVSLAFTRRILRG